MVRVPTFTLDDSWIARTPVSPSPPQPQRCAAEGAFPGARLGHHLVPVGGVENGRPAESGLEVSGPTARYPGSRGDAVRPRSVDRARDALGEARGVHAVAVPPLEAPGVAVAQGPANGGHHAPRAVEARSSGPINQGWRSSTWGRTGGAMGEGSVRPDGSPRCPSFQEFGADDAPPVQGRFWRLQPEITLILEGDLGC